MTRVELADSEERAAVTVELRRLSDCPLAERVRATLNQVAAETGVTVSLVEVEGSFASPSLLVDGADVTGRGAEDGVACRLDLPTEEQVRAALLAHLRRRT